MLVWCYQLNIMWLVMTEEKELCESLENNRNFISELGGGLGMLNFDLSPTGCSPSPQ